MTLKWDILPCPFCGGQPEMRSSETERIDGEFVTHWQLVCLEGGVRLHTSWHTDQSRAVGAWNRRHRKKNA